MRAHVGSGVAFWFGRVSFSIYLARLCEGVLDVCPTTSDGMGGWEEWEEREEREDTE